MRRGFGRVLALAAALACEAAAADSVYVYQPNGGVRTFSDRKPSQGGYAVVKLQYGRATASASCAGLTPTSMAARAASYRELIDKYAAAESVPAALVSAVMRVESCYDRRAVSRSGARGLMQLMPFTARELGVRDSFDPEQNIGGGVRYLAKMLKRFKNNTRLALAAYNAGPEAVDKYRDVPPYPETKNYVRRVLQHYRGNS